MSKGCKTTCLSDQICDPETGRCVHSDNILKVKRTSPRTSLRVSPRESPRASPRTLPQDELLVFNPYYNKPIAVYGEDNCGQQRKSIQKSRLVLISKTAMQKYCDVLPLENIYNILGPITYREYTFGSINISLFGETHQPKNRCPDVRTSIPFGGFLKSLLLQKNHIFYDVYLELAHSHTIDKLSDTQVNFNIITDVFYDCLYKKELCKYKNTRMHKVDYRHYDRRENKVISEKLNYYYNLILYKRDLKPDEMTVDAFTSVTKMVQDELLQDKRLLKQIRNSYLSKDSLYTFLNDEINLYNLQARFNSLKGTDISLWNFFEVFGLVMDMYALARMVRDFRDDKNHMPTRPTNIIIYVGNNHADRYAKFFQNYLHLSQTIDIPENGTSCLHFSPEDKRKSVLFN